MALGVWALTSVLTLSRGSLRDVLEHVVLILLKPDLNVALGKGTRTWCPFFGG